MGEWLPLLPLTALCLFARESKCSVTNDILRAVRPSAPRLRRSFERPDGLAELRGGASVGRLRFKIVDLETWAVGWITEGLAFYPAPAPAFPPKKKSRISH